MTALHPPSIVALGSGNAFVPEQLRYLLKRHSLLQHVHGERCSLNVAGETHVCNETTAQVRTDIASARTNGKETYVLSRKIAGLQTTQNRSTAGMHGTTQVTLIEFIGAFVPIEVAFEEKWRKSISLFRKILWMPSLS